MKSFLIFTFTLIISQNSFASKIRYHLKKCPMTLKKEMNALNCTNVVDQNLNIQFHKIPKNTENKKIMNKLIFNKSSQENLEFLFSGWVDPKAGSVVTIQVLDSKNTQLHYSEITFFEDKKRNFAYLPLLTGNTKNRYIAVIRQVE